MWCSSANQAYAHSFCAAYCTLSAVGVVVLHVGLFFSEVGGGNDVVAVVATVATADAELPAVEEEVGELGVVVGVDAHEGEFFKVLWHHGAWFAYCQPTHSELNGHPACLPHSFEYFFLS